MHLPVRGSDLQGDDARRDEVWQDAEGQAALAAQQTAEHQRATFILLIAARFPL